MFSGSSHRLREGYDSASTAPRSTEGSISEDVFTESELSPIREERQSTEELHQEDKSSGASSQSVQTIAQEPQSPEESQPSACHTDEEEKPDVSKEEGEPASDTAQPNTSTSSRHPSQEQPSTPTSRDHQQPPHCQNKGVGAASGSQSSAPGTEEATGSQGCADGARPSRDSETDVEELRKMCMSHTMQQAKEQRESVQQAQRENVQQSMSTQRQTSAEGTRTCFLKCVPIKMNQKTGLLHSQKECVHYVSHVMCLFNTLCVILC